MKTKFNILVVVTTFPAVTETFIINQITDLIDKGHKVTVFAYVKPKNQPMHQIVTDYDLEKIVVTHFKNAGNKLRIINEAILFYKKHFFQINHLKILSLLNPLLLSKNLKKIKIYYDLPILLFKNQFDIIYFDAFGYRVQPELWSVKIFTKMFEALKKDGILVTYACRGPIKNAMKEAGFKIEKLAGPPGKREMLRGWK